MSDGLTWSHEALQAEPTPSTWRGVAWRIAALLAACAGVGVAGGYLWEWFWTPAQGVVGDGRWFPSPVEEGLQNSFSSVGWFVVVALPIGILIGFVTAFALDHAEVLALIVGLVGSALAVWLMLTVGTRLSPPDPAIAAVRAPDGTTLPGSLEFHGWTPLLSLPAGTLLMMSLVFLLSPRRPEGHAGRSGEIWG
ncbi:hypothetical protein [Nocardioides sp.]|uniref:hypothetical protein n=1 Tax=Nocardioides sp. TaxID=35761 RepID=UPI003568ABC4